MSKIDLSGKIERLEAFEEKFAVRIENASAWLHEQEWVGDQHFFGEVTVLFELHPKVGTTISRDLYVTIAVYNERGQIITSTQEYYDAEEFWGFKVTDCNLGEIPQNEIAKIRIYPTAS